MHDEAVWAANRLVERAQSLGCSSASHYLMPFRVSPNLWDPAQPMSNSGIRKPWDEVRKAADVPWLRIHDLRHTAITRMAEAGVPIPVILSMAGHISVRMQQHYTSVSEYAKRCAVEAAFDGRNYMIAAGRVMENGPRQEDRIRQSAVGARLKARSRPKPDADGADAAPADFADSAELPK